MRTTRRLRRWTCSPRSRHSLCFCMRGVWPGLRLPPISVRTACRVPLKQELAELEAEAHEKEQVWAARELAIKRARTIAIKEREVRAPLSFLLFLPRAAFMSCV